MDVFEHCRREFALKRHHCAQGRAQPLAEILQRITIADTFGHSAPLINFARAQRYILDSFVGARPVFDGCPVDKLNIKVSLGATQIHASDSNGKHVIFGWICGEFGVGWVVLVVGGGLGVDDVHVEGFEDEAEEHCDEEDDDYDGDYAADQGTIAFLLFVALECAVSE